MTLDEFVTKYEGKFVEYHSFGTGAVNQCVDLCNQYIVEVLGLPAIIGTNAQDFPSVASPINYDYLPNTPTGVPQKGDLVIFKSSDKVGHISIFIEGTATKFTSFDQNYPTGSPCKKVGHYYTNVLGWLHPKKVSMSTIYIETSVFENLVSKSTKYDEFVSAGYTSASEVKETIIKLEADLQAKQNAIDENVQDLKEVLAELEEAQEAVSTKDEQLTKLSAQLETLTAQANNQSITISKLEDTVKNLNLQLSAIPQTPEISPTLSNVIALFRLWLKGWLRNGS